MKKIITVLTLLLPTFLLAQKITIQGLVTDKSDKSPLSYVNVYIKNTSQGTYTDVKGRYTITLPSPNAVLVFSCIGYEKQEIIITQSMELNIRLVPLAVSLDEVTVTVTENPADRVMRLVVDNRDKHDPENLESFTYKSYNKFVSEIDRSSDTLLQNLDSLQGFEDTLVNMMNLFLMESVTEKKYKKPGSYKENVLANRVSGIPNAQFVMLASQIQSFSFYKNYIKILGREYLSPISTGNTNKYLFVLQDTVDENGTTLFVIYYQPRKNKNFEGLTGLLYIDTASYALTKATAKIADKNNGFETQIIQHYTKIGEAYFPTLFTSDFIFKSIKITLRDSVTGPKTFSPLGKARTTIYDIDLNNGLTRKDFDNVELDYEKDAQKKDDAFWDLHRKDKLTAKDSLTYVIIDSVADDLNLERRLGYLKILNTRKIPIKFINIHVDDLFKFNNFEGFRPGLTLSTNDYLSSRFSIGGYYAYGFKDVHSKYGGNATLFLNKNQSSAFTVAYSNDVAETGIHPYGHYKLTDDERYRNLYVSVMDRVEKSSASLGFRLLRYVTADIGAELINKKVTTTYRFGDGAQEYFKFANTTVNLRWAPGEKLVRRFGILVPKENNGFVLNATITKGFKGIADGQFDFLRTDIMLTHNFRILNVGRSYIRVQGGMVDGVVPYTEMYFGRAGFNNKNLSIVSPYSFETMRYNEFFGNNYAAVFFRHSFGHLLFKTKKFKPEVLLVTNAYVSNFTNTANHKGFDLKPANKGFYESGLQINNIITRTFMGYGVGFFYRYGPYSFDTPGKNMAVKLSFSFAI